MNPTMYLLVKEIKGMLYYAITLPMYDLAEGSHWTSDPRRAEHYPSLVQAVQHMRDQRVRFSARHIYPAPFRFQMNVTVGS